MLLRPQGTYIRLGPLRYREHSSRSSRRSDFIFLDVPEAENVERILEWTGVHRTLSPTTPVVARFDGSLSDLKEMTDRLGVTAPVGILDQVVGHDALIDWSHAFKEGEVEPVPQQLRCIELDALLTWGHGKWEPKDYHFRLPSGQHSGAFIRISHAIVDPRAAKVLARWFDPHLGERVGLVVDSRRMTSLVLAIEDRIRQGGWTPGPVEVLEEYPITSFDVTSLIRRVRSESDKVLGLISVSSSGSLLSLLNSALDAAVNPGNWRSVVMVDRLERDEPEVDTWMHYPDAARDGVLYTTSCALCTDPSRAFLISVDPMTFDGMLPYQIRTERPSVGAQQRNKRFWEVAAQYCGLEELPEPAVSTFRPRRSRMSVRIKWSELVSDPTLSERVAERAKRLDAVNRRLVDPDRYREFTPEADLILCPDHEVAYEGHSDLISVIAEALGLENPEVEGFPAGRRETWSEDLQTHVQKARSILILSLGAVTGRSLGRAKRAIQEAKRLHSDGEYLVQALVVHARPDSPRDYRDLWNVLDHLLFSLWLSYIPDTQSPLRDESEVVQALVSSGQELSEAAKEFLEHRNELFAGRGPGSGSVFWGFPADAQTTPYALAGDLDATGAYAATGTAIQEARTQDPPQLPLRRVFDMAGIVRSYFDEVLIAGFLRWIGPHEMGWMIGPDSAHDPLQQLLERSADEHLRAGLLAELLLACALGKIPKVDRDYLIGEAQDMISRADTHTSWRGALELGLAVLGLTERD